MSETRDDDAFFTSLIDQYDQQKKKKSYGKKLHGEIMRALREIPGCRFVRSWDDAQIPATLRPADIQVCLPPDGLSVLIECKETRVGRIDFSRIDDLQFSTLKKPRNNQRRSLMLHAMSGGLSLIAVQRIYANQSRTWLIPFQLWEHLRRELPRESIPLDSGRPASILEAGLLHLNGKNSSLCEDLVNLRAQAQALPIMDYRYE